jgi:hypothetical protein
VYNSVYLVLVGKHNYLPCYEKYEQEPGIKNIVFAFFQTNR